MLNEEVTSRGSIGRQTECIRLLIYTMETFKTQASHYAKIAITERVGGIVFLETIILKRVSVKYVKKEQISDWVEWSSYLFILYNLKW